MSNDKSTTYDAPLHNYRTSVSMSLDARDEGAHTLDPRITYYSVEATFVGHVYGESTTSQATLYQLGLTGISITNVNNS